MAAGLGFKTFTTGEVLTAGDVNGYLMQGINVFTNATARDAAITAPAEGQFAFTKDNNSLWYYDGAAWVASGATGDIEGVTAGVGISGGGTSGTVTVTNSMATAIDAKGDLVPGTGADTFARLAVGANGTVLTADSAEATGLKWATPASGSTFKGASVYAGSSQSITNATWTTMNWNSESWDTDAFHDNSTNNSRFTVPAGLAGKYQLNVQIVFGDRTSTGAQATRILKNGSIVYYGLQWAPDATAYTGVIQNVTVDGAVADYFEVQVYQSSGGTRGTGAGAQDQYFQFDYLGA
jgi:hypothetical protein